MAGSDYEHWAEESSSPRSEVASTITAASGYDSQNGLRAFKYHGANQEQKEAKESKEAKSEPAKPEPAACACAPPPPQPAAQPQPAPGPQQVYYLMGGYPQMQYAPYPQQMYYGYPQGGMPFYGAPMYQPPAVAAPAEEKKDDKKDDKKKKEKPEVKKWQGRTRAEVEEDNMKIAAREEVCAPRKVEPKNLKEDQMVWCVEIDGSHTLRTYASVKDFNGDWKTDPRFKDSWYFVREEEEKGEE